MGTSWSSPASEDTENATTNLVAADAQNIDIANVDEPQQHNIDIANVEEHQQQAAPTELPAQQAPLDLQTHLAAAPQRNVLQFAPAARAWSGAAQPRQLGYMDVSGSPKDFSQFDDDDALPDAQPEAAAAAACAAQPEPEDEVQSSGSLTISSRIEYSSIPRNREQNVFGIVTLQASQAKPEQKKERQPVDLICVLDVSGSMTGDKIRLVQEAVRFVIRESDKKDRVSIVSFSSQAQRVLKLRRMDEEGRDEAMQATFRLTAGGGTHISAGVEAALEVAERRRQQNPVTAIFLLTDGQDRRSANTLPALINRAQRLGCSIYPFGFGADHDAQLLNTVAEQAQTPFSFVEDVDGIASAFAGAVGGLVSVCAQRVEVTLNCHVTLKSVHTPFTTVREGNSAKIQIPDVLAGERRDILVELSVPEAATQEETVLLDASAKYWDLQAEASVQTPMVQMLAQRVPDAEQPEQEPDEEVSVQRHRVQVAQTLQAAADRSESGRFAEAQDMLDTHCKRLRSENKKLSKITEGLAVELEDARSRMKSRSSWEDGGRAEVLDAKTMHMQQRSTNLCQSSKSAKKSSKAMYVTMEQESWISKSWGASG